MQLFTGLFHESNLVKFITGIALFSAAGMLFVAVAVGQKSFPGLDAFIPFSPWVIFAGIVSGIIGIIPWHKQKRLPFLPLVSSAIVITLLVVAGFLYSPILWLNILSIVMLLRWATIQRNIRNNA